MSPINQPPKKSAPTRKGVVLKFRLQNGWLITPKQLTFASTSSDPFAHLGAFGLLWSCRGRAGSQGTRLPPISDRIYGTMLFSTTYIYTTKINHSYRKIYTVVIWILMGTNESNFESPNCTTRKVSSLAKPSQAGQKTAGSIVKPSGSWGGLQLHPPFVWREKGRLRIQGYNITYTPSKKNDG